MWHLLSGKVLVMKDFIREKKNIIMDIRIKYLKNLKNKILMYWNILQGLMFLLLTYLSMGKNIKYFK